VSWRARHAQLLECLGERLSIGGDRVERDERRLRGRGREDPRLMGGIERDRRRERGLRGALGEGAG
jgi:hypothetical protein